MSLLPSLSLVKILAAAPLVVVFGPFVLSVLQRILSHPLICVALGTLSVVLNTTESVWRPLMNVSIILTKQILNGILYIAPIVKALVRSGVNATVTLVRNAQAIGMSFATAFPTVMLRIQELGGALLVIGRTLSGVVYYGTKSVALVLGSVEQVFLFSKQLLFEAHLLTVDDVYNVMLPFAIVGATIGTLYWLRTTPLSVQRCDAPQTCEEAKPRRSSRLIRKRAILYGSDMLPACQKSSFTSSNL